MWIILKWFPMIRKGLQIFQASTINDNTIYKIGPVLSIQFPNGVLNFRSLWYKAKARTEKEQTSFSFGWLQRAAARARHTACQCRRRRLRRRTRPLQAAGSWAAKRRLSVPEAPKYIKVRKVFDLSRLHLALLGLSSSSQPDLLWLVTLPLKVKHFVVM